MQVPGVTSAKYQDNIRKIIVPYYRNLYSLQRFFFFNFCKSVDHDERNWLSYELMVDRTPLYRMQVENHA